MRYKNFRLEQRHAVQTGRERHIVQNGTDIEFRLGYI
jgi:hypothetical protein